MLEPQARPALLHACRPRSLPLAPHPSGHTLASSQAAWKAVEYVKSGDVVGLGTGSTAAFAVDRIGDLLASGELKNIVGVPTSIRTYEQAKGVWGLVFFGGGEGAVWVEGRACLVCQGDLGCLVGRRHTPNGSMTTPHPPSHVPRRRPGHPTGHAVRAARPGRCHRRRGRGGPCVERGQGPGRRPAAREGKRRGWTGGTA